MRNLAHLMALKLDPGEILKALFIFYVYWILIFGRYVALIFCPYATWLGYMGGEKIQQKLAH